MGIVGPSGSDTSSALRSAWRGGLVRRSTCPPDEGDPEPVDGQAFNAGDRPPVGVAAFPGMEPNDLMLWVETRRALVAGDTLVDRGNGLEFRADWASQGAIAERGVPPEQILEGLRSCWSCRSSSFSQRMAGRPTAPPSSTRSTERPTTARELVGLRRGGVRARSRPATRSSAGGQRSREWGRRSRTNAAAAVRVWTPSLA